MGMAASQVRFLSLQNRRSTIGLNLMTLSNRRTALSNDMKKVANAYNEAMNQKILKWSSDSGVTYTDISYDLMMKPNDLNAMFPYILTDEQGRVVLDDRPLVMNGKTVYTKAALGDIPAGSTISYRDIATLVSSCTEFNGKFNTFNNTQNLEFGSDGKAISGKPADPDYRYAVTDDFQTGAYKQNLRYDILVALGLMEPSEVTEIKDIDAQLYGSGGQALALNYDSVLKDFDRNIADATVKYQEITGSDSLDYNELFGQMNFDAGYLSIEGGCEYGKVAYLSRLYDELGGLFNTKFDRQFFGARQYNIREAVVEQTSEGGLTTIQADGINNTQSKYNYDKEFNEGLSNRVLDFICDIQDQGFELDSRLNFIRSIDGDGKENYDYWTSSILGDASIDAKSLVYGDIGSNHYPLFGANYTSCSDSIWFFDWTDKTDWALDETLAKDRNSLGIPDVTSLEALLYVGNTGGSEGKISYNGEDSSYISGRTGRIAYTFAPYADDPGDIHKEDYWREDNSGFKGHNDSNMTYILEKVSQSLQGQGLDKALLDQAKDYVYHLYFDDFCVSENDDGSLKHSWALNRAGNEAIWYNTFGFGQCNHQGSEHDAVSYDFSLFIQSYLTFYDMLYQAQQNGGYIEFSSSANATDLCATASSYTKMYKANIANASKNGDTTTAKINKIMNALMIPSTGGSVVQNTYKNKSGIHTVANQYVCNDTGTIAIVTPDDGTKGFTKISIYGAKNKAAKDDKTEADTNQLFYEYTIDSLTGQIKGLHYGTVYNNATNSYINKVRYEIVYKNGTTNADIKINYPDAGYNITSIHCNGGNDVNHVTIWNGTNNITDSCKVGANSGYCLKDANGNGIGNYSILKYNAHGSTFGNNGSIQLKDTSNLRGQVKGLLNSTLENIKHLESSKQGIVDRIEKNGSRFFDALFKRVAKKGWVYDSNVNQAPSTTSDDKSAENSRKYLTSKLQSGLYYITEVNEVDFDTFDYQVHNAKNVSRMFEVFDDNATNVALSKYEAEKAEINSKEKLLDMRINKLEAEDSALKTEMDSLKKIIDDNVQKTFKIFS